MALEEYKRKRDFQKTSEPRPGPVKARGRELAYLIQKHDATRLHYDFRLELDGVLLSWAVTKGPSRNPADKRLAVRTEDHPLSYGAFEGTIPQGQYGGGTVMLWDQGTWEPKGDPHAGLNSGHLSFILHGERLKGAWDLIRMRGQGKRENWLLIKERDTDAGSQTDNDSLDETAVSVKSGRSMDEIAGGKKEPGASVSLEKLLELYPGVQLATLVDRPPEGAHWLHETKFDGYRLQGFAAGGTVCLRTRNGKEWTAKFPSLATALEKLKARSVVLDMEAVVIEDDGKSSFQALQAALGGGGRANSIVAYVFDILHLDGKDLTKTPLRDRKRVLEALLKKPAPGKARKADVLRYSEHVEGDGAELLSRACAMGLEGIVSKQADAPYVAGRTKSWLKSKCGHRQEFIIVGYSDARKGERALGAVYLGYRGQGELQYAGKAGTGFSMKSARDLAERLTKLAVRKPVFERSAMGRLAAAEWQSIHWVRPELLCEVAFTEWTADNQLRHPSFQGLREDKDAAEVKKEKPWRAK